MVRTGRAVVKIHRTYKTEQYSLLLIICQYRLIDYNNHTGQCKMLIMGEWGEVHQSSLLSFSVTLK